MTDAATTLSPKAAAPPAEASDRAHAKKRAQARAGLMRQMLRWHWISAAVSLVGLLLFTITGVTLNHADLIGAEPQVTRREGVLPAAERPALLAAGEAEGPLPDGTRRWLRDELGVRAPAGAAVEWTDGEAYVALPRPGADAWVSVDGTTGATEYERTERGWVAYLNDLHKGRDTGLAWKAFIDIFAVASLVFCVTGFVLLQLHAKLRPSTWPLVGLGLLVPMVIAMFLIH